MHYYLYFIYFFEVIGSQLFKCLVKKVIMQDSFYTVFFNEIALNLFVLEFNDVDCRFDVHLHILFEIYRIFLEINKKLYNMINSSVILRYSSLLDVLLISIKVFIIGILQSVEFIIILSNYFIEVIMYLFNVNAIEYRNLFFFLFVYMFELCYELLVEFNIIEFVSCWLYLFVKFIYILLLLPLYIVFSFIDLVQYDIRYIINVRFLLRLHWFRYSLKEFIVLHDINLSQ